MTYRTPTSISLSWRAADDNDRVTRYGAYVDAVLVGDATSEAYTFADLKCGRNYTLAVDAVDATGNRSAPATTMIATRACPDGTSPTSPAVIVNGSTTASVSVGWRAATDNVGRRRIRAVAAEPHGRPPEREEALVHVQRARPAARRTSPA